LTSSTAAAQVAEGLPRLLTDWEEIQSRYPDLERCYPTQGCHVQLKIEIYAAVSNISKHCPAVDISPPSGVAREKKPYPVTLSQNPASSSRVVSGTFLHGEATVPTEPGENFG
jgi:hypothetical protein